MLIRFDSSDRSPSASLFQGLLDFVRGSLATLVGTSDFDDFKPYISTAISESGSSGHAIAHRADRNGVVRISATAGSNANTEVVRPSYFDPSKTPTLACEAYITQNVTANSPQAFVGYSDVAVGSILASADVASGSAQNTLAIVWRANKTFDLMSVVGGTKNTLIAGIGVTFDPATGAVKVGFKIEKMSTTLYRITPCVNGSIARAGCVNVVNTKIPEVPMKLAAGTTVSATTAPSMDIDWMFAVDK